MKFSLCISKGSRNLVKIDNIDIVENGITFLFGESGIGKTLIARAIYGLLDANELEIRINDLPYREYLEGEFCRRIKAGGFFVFQEPSTHLNPLQNLEDQISEGSLAAVDSYTALNDLWPDSKKEDLEQLLGVYPKPYRPSGGEKQRVLLAMAFKKMRAVENTVQKDASSYFFFDEPTGSLDNLHRNNFIRALIKRYRKFQPTILVITHDYSIINELAASHADLAGSFHFLELTREAKKLSVNNFSARTYLDWLQGLKACVNKSDGPATPLMRISGDTEIFGRKFSIYREPKSKDKYTLEIHGGDMVYVKAPSGTGKTTLAKIIMGLLKADQLDLQIDGLSLNQKTTRTVWKKKVWAVLAGMVFQHADEALNLKSRVAGLFKGIPRTHKDILSQLRLLFGNEADVAFLRRKIEFLSGGQKQRLNLLRTMVLDTRLLILDEPLNGLDFRSMQKIIKILQDKQRQGKSILIISHNEEIFDRIVPTDRIYYLGASSG